MSRSNGLVRTMVAAVAALGMCVGMGSKASADPLTIVYSDWPGWVPWEIAIQKGWFEEEGVEVEFKWFDYVAGMDAYVAGQVDACSMTNGDALVIGATGRPSVTILINDYSNGNDMFIAKPGIESVKDLKGKKVGAELGFVAHLLAITALTENGLSADDVEWVNTPTNETPAILAGGDVSAVAAWQPSSGEALKAVPGSKAIFTSADAPGIIYDVLCVSPESLAENREEWMKVIKVWYRVVEYIKDEDNWDDALQILAARVQVTPEEYEPFFEGTYILSLDEAMKVWQEGDGLDSIYGSTDYSNKFNVKYEAYGELLDYKTYLDPSLMKEYVESMK